MHRGDRIDEPASWGVGGARVQAKNNKQRYTDYCNKFCTIGLTISASEVVIQGMGYILAGRN